MLNTLVNNLVNNADVFYNICTPEINDRFKVVGMEMIGGKITPIIYIPNKGNFDLPMSSLPKNWEGKTLIIKDIQTFIKERDGVQHPIRKYLIDFAK